MTKTKLNERKLLLLYLIFAVTTTLLLESFNIIEKEISLTLFIVIVANFINAYGAFATFDFSIELSNQKFLKYVLGGMAIRIAFILLVFLTVFLVLNISKIIFILFFFINYFIFLFWEIAYYKKKLEKKEYENDRTS